MIFYVEIYRGEGDFELHLFRSQDDRQHFIDKIPKGDKPVPDWDFGDYSKVTSHGGVKIGNPA